MHKISLDIFWGATNFMWNLTVKFSSLNHASEFINKLQGLDKIEYHIDTNFDIVVSGENIFAKELVLEMIAESIVTIFKTRFFENNMNVPFLTAENREALVKALVMFDIESDIYYVLTCIENMSTIVLSSINAFLLPKIKNKWNEFVTIANLNGNYLLNYEIFVEFLKFLINSIQPKTSVINLKCDVNKFLFFDDNDRLLTSKISLDDEMGLITNLVVLAPKNINIHCIGQVSNKTFKTLYYLFDKKINLIV